jgi:hypothetical protein
MIPGSISLAKVGSGRINPVHLIIASLFLILSIITIRAILFGDSLFDYRDLAASDPRKALENAISVFDLESTRRLLYLGPYFAATSILGLSTLMVQKITLLLTHFIIGFLAYLASYKFLTSKIKNEKYHRTILIVSFIFGFFYLYNPRVSEGLSLTALGIGLSYSLIPLIFYYFDRVLNEKGFYNIVVAALLISLAIAGTMQFLVLLPLFVLLPWLIIVVIHRWIKKYSVILTIKNSLILIAFWFLLSSYWLIIAILATLSGSDQVQPSYVLTNQSLDLFSSTTSLVNVFRLLGAWWPWIELTPIIDQSLWNVFTFFVPIAVVLSILLLKDQRLKFYALSFALIVMFVIFFNKGNQPPLTDIYPLLYDVPLVGWMFRVPSSVGRFLPFYMGMIITFGLYSLLSYRPKKMRYFKYGLASTLVLSISIISWPMFTGDFGGIYQDNNKFIENSLPEESYHIDAPSESIMVFGDLNKLKLAESLFRANHSSLIMTGHNLNVLQQNELNPDKVILDDKEDLPFYFLDNNSVLIEPFTSTRNHSPDKVWSIAGTDDPLHAPFHMYLENFFGINNTDMDYSKGLVFTWNRDKLQMPLEVADTTDYHLFARYLGSEAGGEMKVSLNGITASIFTDSSENKFVWKDIGTFHLPNGKHTLMLENHNGLNAVNLFVLIPSHALTELNDRVESFIDRNKLIYILDSDDLFAPGSDKTIIDEQSNQTALRIGPHSSAYSDIDIAKASNYIIAINAKTCKECQTLNVSIGSVSKQFSLQSRTEGFQWLYFPVTLEAGKTNLRIYSEEGAYVSRALIQSGNNEERPHLFAVKETPIVMSDIKRLSPTKYEISVSAERRPFMITLDRPYDNLWSAFVNGTEYSSLMLYPSINGFYIDDTGFLDITIEYKPQRWFIQGAIITVITIIGSVGYLLWQKRERIADYSEWFRTKVLDHREAGGSIQ